MAGNLREELDKWNEFDKKLRSTTSSANLNSLILPNNKEVSEFSSNQTTYRIVEPLNINTNPI